MKKFLLLMLGAGVGAAAYYAYKHKEELKNKAEELGKEIKEEAEDIEEEIENIEDKLEEKLKEATAGQEDPEAAIPEELLEEEKPTEKPKRRGRPKKDAEL